MSRTADPIRCKVRLKGMADYWLHRDEQIGETKAIKLRNYVFIVLGTLTALRVSDLLRLTWDDVYDATYKNFRSHITLTEKKTKKHKQIALNWQVINALKLYFPHRHGNFIFSNYRKDGKAITRVQAWRIVKISADATMNITATSKTNINTTSTTNTTAKISPHSLRKTFGYFAWKNKISPVLLMDIYNHSSFKITQRYLGITQDERDEIYLGAILF